MWFELLLLTSLQAAPAASACASMPGFLSLSAWAGEWDVSNAAGRAAGQSRVEVSPDGCGLVEHWEGLTAKGTVLPGTGLHAFDRATQGWRHLWVDASGFTAVLTGRVADGRVVYERTAQPSAGVERQHRMTLAPSEGRVIQTGEHSDDGGRTWSRDFQLTYTRRAGRAGSRPGPAAPTAR